MENGGFIELQKGLKAYMEAPDIILVDKSKHKMANEARLYFEVCLGIATAFLGASFGDFSYWLLSCFLGFSALTIFFAVRFIKLDKVGPLIELKGIISLGATHEP